MQKLSIPWASCTAQGKKTGEDLDLYLKCHEEALDFRDPVHEEVLVNVLHCMDNEYHIFLEKLYFSSFSNWQKHQGKEKTLQGGLQSQVEPIQQQGLS